VEVNFYLRVCQKPQIDAFRWERGLDHLGVPHFVASGFCMFNKKKLRFLVLPRYGMDLQSILDTSGGKTFSTQTACTMAIQVVSTKACLLATTSH
jgi:vaccinia related kinase